MKASAVGAAGKAATSAAGIAVDTSSAKDASSRAKVAVAKPTKPSPETAPKLTTSKVTTSKVTSPKSTPVAAPQTISDMPSTSPKPAAKPPAKAAPKGLAEPQAPAPTEAAPAPEVAPAPAEPAPAVVSEAPRAVRQPDSRMGQMTMQNGRPVPPSRAAAKEENFVDGDFVVYPTHGVGKVEKIAVEEIAGHKLELIHITFEENRMTLRVPVAKARSAGLRKLSTRKQFDEALAVLKGRARVKRTMWSRRAQEYEAKINSGDPMAIAEVVRDLHRNAGQPDQSFSERQIYEAALDRLAAELAALDETDKMTAIIKLGNFLKAA